MTCRSYGGEERRIKHLSEKTVGKRSLERLRSRWENNIEMDLQKMGCWSTDWNELVQDRDKRRALVNVLMNFRIP